VIIYRSNGSTPCSVSKSIGFCQEIVFGVVSVKTRRKKTGGGQNSYNNLPRFKLGGRVITGLFFCAGQTRDTVGQAFDNKTIRKVAQRRRGTAKIVIDLPTIVEYGCTAWPGNPPTTWFF
jgi:hypothetical protein